MALAVSSNRSFKHEHIPGPCCDQMPNRPAASLNFCFNFLKLLHFWLLYNSASVTKSTSRMIFASFNLSTASLNSFLLALIFPIGYGEDNRVALVAAFYTTSVLYPCHIA
jgi:hypothetical protein